MRILALLLGLLLGLAAPADAAWASISTLGQVGDATAGTTIVLTTTATLEAGNVGIISVAKDETSTGTSDGDNNECTSATDSAGNTWVKAIEFANTNTSSAADGIVVCVFYTKATTQLTSGGTITVNFSASTTASALTSNEYTIGGGNVVSIEASATLANDGVDPGSMDLSPPSAAYLWYRPIASETGDVTNITTTASFSGFFGIESTPGGGATAVKITGEWRIFTGSTNPSDPTLVAADHASAYLAFKEAAPASGCQPMRTLVGVGC